MFSYKNSKIGRAWERSDRGNQGLSTTQNKENCNNCGKYGHLFHQCKMPITSVGIIAFRFSTEIEYLLIRRKNTLGFIDFMRGKYSVYNKDYIVNMFKQMTIHEKKDLLTKPFQIIWNEIWGDEPVSGQYKIERQISQDKFNLLNAGINANTDNFYNLTTIITELDTNNNIFYPTYWEEPEWGFPKGRRNNNENDFNCALREFSEETGYSIHNLHHIQNILPFEEIFTGSNYKSYKHKYFLMFMKYEDTLNTNNFQTTEVSKMEWKNFENTLCSLRKYNLEKKNVITNVDKCLKSFSIVNIG